VPEAIAWLESCPLTAEQIAENPLLAGRTHPTFVELGTNRPRFAHRFGSDIVNGAYYVDHDHRDTLSHYSAGRAIDIDGLKATYDQLRSMSPAEVAELVRRSPLTPGKPVPLPRFFSLRDLDLTDLFRDTPFTLPQVTADQAAALVDDLGDKDHWLTPVDAVTNAYRGPGPATPYDGRAYLSKNVGDLYDTSPYDPLSPPAEPPYEPRDRPLVISSETYIGNMGQLIAYVAAGHGR